MNQPLRLAVLLSGSGTTLQNLLDRCARGELPASVAVVERKACPSREDFEPAPARACKRKN